jgi:membrane associated rhomboid family serine protease
MNLTYYIILITSLISLIGFKNENLMNKLQFNAYSVKYSNEKYRFISAAFVHANFIHLLVNMFVLYFFGKSVEYFYKYFFQEKYILYFLLLYFGGAVFSLLTTYKKHQENMFYNAVGASGAVSAVVTSSIIFTPLNNICLYGVFCMPGILWVIIYIAYSYFASKKGDSKTNHEAHLWGSLFGIIFTIILKPSLVLVFIENLSKSF